MRVLRGDGVVEDSAVEAEGWDEHRTDAADGPEVAFYDEGREIVADFYRNVLWVKVLPDPLPEPTEEMVSIAKELIAEGLVERVPPDAVEGSGDERDLIRGELESVMAAMREYGGNPG